jgi:type 1 fimbria pilin
MKARIIVIIGIIVVCCAMVTSSTWAQDNGNGTITVGGLVWLKDAGCFANMGWNAADLRAKSMASGQCSLTDQSVAGRWRLPSYQ